MNTTAVPVRIPLLNPNEPEALLADLSVQEGQQVQTGDVLCTLETTKSTAELCAETAGYVSGLRFSQGDTVRAGDTLCYLAPSPDWSMPPGPEGKPAGQPQVPDGLRISQPALALARQHELDLSLLPSGPLVTESEVRSILEQYSLKQNSLEKSSKQEGKPDLSPPPAAFDATAVLVYGGGSHSKLVIDLLRTLSAYKIAGVVDDRLQPGDTVLDVPVLGSGEILPDLYARGIRLAVNAVGGVGNVSVRIEVFRRLAEAGFVFPGAVHPTAFVEPSAVLAPGVQVFAQAYIGSQAQIGFGTIVHTGVIVSHDCRLGDYVNTSPGTILAGSVEVGSGTLIGMGATVNLGVKIGAGARIGNGATVLTDVPERGLVQAGRVWPDPK